MPKLPSAAFSSSLSTVAVLALAAACGSRTGLFAPTESGNPPIDGGLPDEGVDSGCPQHDNPWLVFDTSSTMGGSETMYAMRADGSAGHFVQLPHAPAYFPSVSPDGTELLYATPLQPDAGGGGGPNAPDSALYAYDLVAHTERLLVTTQGLTYSALSPDRQTVAYVSLYSLHAASPGGANDRTLLAGPNGDGAGYGHPTFADSQTVVYGTGGAIGAIGIDGSNNRTLVMQTATLLYPNVGFSPDHQRLAAGVYCDPTTAPALAVYDWASLPAPCGSGQVLAAVTESSSFNGANDPSWGPTDLIAYGSGTDVYVVPATGGTPTDVTQSLTDAGMLTAEEPVWAPGCVTVP